MPAAGSTVNLTGASATDPALATLLAKHAVHAVSALSAAHVRAKRQLGRSETDLAAAMRQRFPARALRAPANATPPDLSSTFVFDLGDRSTAEVAATVRALQSDPNVLYAEEDKFVHACFMPNDPSYSKSGSWGQPYNDLYGLLKIGTTAAWDVTQGQGVVVAVIDSGVDYNHPDIKDNIWANPGETRNNSIDDDHNGFIDDTRGWDFVGANASKPVEGNNPIDVVGHGTHVAGTIAATGNNLLGVIGVAWKAKIMIVKALDDTGAGNDSAIAKAIIYAVDNGADVINASWGGYEESQTVTDAINYAYAHGVVFVAAAGNDASDVDSFFPANATNAIAVSATDALDQLVSFSNYGSKIELAAPGDDILSLEAGTNGYVRKSGTSMAAPHVSGAAALIIARHPTYSNDQVRQALRISALHMGPAGRNTSFGYGLVYAAWGVLVDQVLGVKIVSPTEGILTAAATSLTGTAQGPGFDHYVVDYGAGTTPGTWVTIRNSTTSVVNGDIGTFDPTTLPDGTYTLRLRAFDTGGNVFSDQIPIQVRYLAITWPLPPATPSLTQEVKPGTTYQIAGTAIGPSFQNFILEWAPGTAATTGWSTEGITLAGAGLTPVINGTLGTWTTPSTLSGDYTLRLTAKNSGFSSQLTSVVYAEPALLSSRWPMYVDKVYPSILPMRQPDGSTRLLVGGADGFLETTSKSCYSYGLDGSVLTAPLDFAVARQPCVGNLDGQPGDEAVIADGLTLKIFSSNLSLIRTITASKPRVFWPDQTLLADLDNDGIPEIIAPARDTQSANGTSYRESGALYVYRADGTLFSDHYPLPITSPLTVSGAFGGFYGVQVVAVDLNGDGQKEIVMAVTANDYSGYTVRAINADGTPCVGWTEYTVQGAADLSIAAADLDDDGTNEIVLVENSKGTNQIRVLNHDGLVRPGWPVILDNSNLQIAIGDLDRDRHHEIVAATNSTLSVFRGDGTLRSPSHPIADGTGMNMNNGLLIADIDHDGLPEILLVNTAAKAGGLNNNAFISLICYSRDGSVQQNWPLFGVNGQQPASAVPLVGAFSGDGRTNLVVLTSLLEDHWATNAALTCLTTGATFDAADAEWVCNLHDPLNSRTVNIAPLFTTTPRSRSVTVGTPAIFTAAAGGNPIPTFQWQRNGADIPGATRATLTLNNVSFADADNYSVVVSNSMGSVTSAPATLTVTNKGTATVTLGNLTATYDGAPKAATATTNPTGLTVAFTYDGNANLPSTPGSYAVVATVNDGNYLGSASGTLVIAPGAPAALTTDGYGASATGGGSAAAVTVSNAAEFKNAAEAASPAVIAVSGILTLTGKVNVASAKTIQGLDQTSTIIGNLELAGGVTNVVIRGLNITNPAGDGITLAGASDVFITHCTLFDCSGYLLNITSGASNVTASWNEFYYSSSQAAHRYAVQIGNSTGESFPLRVTLHHNWWSTFCDQRLPESNYGYVHLYNNYYNLTGNTAGAAALTNAQLLVERNEFDGLANPLSKAGSGSIYAFANAFSGTALNSADTVFTPPYSYELIPTANVPSTITAPAPSAGAGNIAGASSVTPAPASATITGTPSVAVPPGGTFTLTAMPAGFAGSAWQWRLNNAALMNGTNATYTVASMTSAYAGVYTVMIGRSAGSDVVSSPVTVTLGSSSSSSSGSSSSSSSSSGGGSGSGGGSSGGGGASEPWGLGATGLLCLLRRALRRSVW
jgi:subtilisin family serine protease/pectate lyase